MKVIITAAIEAIVIEKTWHELFKNPFSLFWSHFRDLGAKAVPN